MTQVRNTNGVLIGLLDTSGNVIPVEKNVGCTVTAGTYFAMLGTSDSLIQSVQVHWDAVAAGAVSVETCNLPRASASNPGAVTDYSTTAGQWVHQDPSTAYVPVTGGATVTNATVTVAGGTAGSAWYDLGNFGAERSRIKLVLGTGGVVMIATLGKT